MGQARHRFHHQPAPAVSQQGQWPQVDEQLLRALPPVLRGVVKALGYGRALDWLRWRGGVEWHIPIKLKFSHSIGLEQDELARLRIALEHHLGADNMLWLPKPDKMMLYMRNSHIRRERGSKTVRDLAMQNGLTDRQVRNICRDGAANAEMGVDPRQQWLFGEGDKEWM